MTQIGNLMVRLGADTSDLSKGLGEAQQQLRGMQRSAMPAIKAVAAVGAAATGAAAAVFAFGRAGMNAIDEQAKLARQLDATIGGLRGLQLAGEDAGVATGTMNSAIERLNMTLGQASRGAGTAGDALDRLGLSARDLIAMDADERMAAIADRVQQLGLSGAETADVLRQMGIRQRELVNLMREGGDAIRDARQEVEDYGLALDDVDVAMIEAANDAFSRVGLVVESVRNAVATELAPVILIIAQRFNDAAREAGGWGEVVASAAETSIRVIGNVLDALERVRRGFLLAGQGAALFALVVNRWMAEAERSIRTQPLQALVDLVDGLRELPGVGALIGGSPLDIFSRTLLAQSEAGQQDVEMLRGAVEEGMADMRETMNAPMPSTWLQSFQDDIDEMRRTMAESVGDGDGGMFDGLFGDRPEGDPLGIDTDEAAESIREHLAERLELLREGLMTERELERERLHERMEELAEMREHELINQREHLELLEEAQREHAERMNAIDERENRERQRLAEQTARKEMQLRQDVASNAISLLNTLGSENRAFALASIALTKGLAIAQTLAHTQTASMLAFASQLVPGDPSSYARAAAAAGRVQTMGRINAALIAAQGLAQAGATMSSGSSGAGSGAGGSVGGSGSSAGAASAPAAQPVRENLVANLNITGQNFSRRQVVELIDQINSLQDDGMRVQLRTS